MFFITASAEGQYLSLQTNIASGLQESSGLLYLNGKLITHNDSGDEPALYEIDTSNGIQTRKVIIQNASNIDWEDIAMDQHYIYIGDFGNNQGSRTNLRIYKVAKQDYLTMDTILADTILFDYNDQVDFTPTNFMTNYDAEALISYGDSLYIFTKNWGNSRTNIYPISKNPGQYSLTRKDSLNSQGWITGAVCDSAQKQILLIGYTFNSCFFLKINNWNQLFSSGQIIRQTLQPNSSIQIEGIAQIDSFTYFVSSENFQSTISQLHKLDCRIPTNLSASIKEENIELYPNPCHETLYVKSNKLIKTIIRSVSGRVIMITKKKEIDISNLKAGIYFVETESYSQSLVQKIIIQ